MMNMLCLSARTCQTFRKVEKGFKVGDVGVAAQRSEKKRKSFSCSAAASSFIDEDDLEQRFVLQGGMIDYYEVLGVDDDASDREIKAAYRALAKVCHPDISGDERGHNMCIVLNEAYQTLTDPDLRRDYNQALDEALTDEDDGYTGELLSKWCANTNLGKNTDLNEDRGVFVDELTCIGCKQCVWCAPATFRIEDDYGRSRVFAQWVDKEEDIQAAMDACPVSCIHWVNRNELPALEFVSKYKIDRVNVGLMMSNQGGYVPDVWDATARYMKDREAKKATREKQAQYSRAQAAARRAAAEDLARQQRGWFEDVMSKLGIDELSAKAFASMNETIDSSYSDDEYSAYQKVGRRQRRRRPDATSYGSRGMNGGRVAQERALVHVGAALPSWKKKQ